MRGVIYSFKIEVLNLFEHIDHRIEYYYKLVCVDWVRTNKVLSGEVGSLGKKKDQSKVINLCKLLFR